MQRWTRLHGLFQGAYEVFPNVPAHVIRSASQQTAVAQLLYNLQYEMLYHCYKLIIFFCMMGFHRFWASHIGLPETGDKTWNFLVPTIFSSPISSNDFPSPDFLCSPFFPLRMVAAYHFCGNVFCWCFQLPKIPPSFDGNSLRYQPPPASSGWTSCFVESGANFFRRFKKELSAFGENWYTCSVFWIRFFICHILLPSKVVSISYLVFLFRTLVYSSNGFESTVTKNVKKCSGSQANLS